MSSDVPPGPADPYPSAPYGSMPSAASGMPAERRPGSGAAAVDPARGPADEGRGGAVRAVHPHHAAHPGQPAQPGDEHPAQEQRALTASQVDSAVSVAIVIAVVVGLVSVGLWLWMASANGKGRSWARIVATVLGALSVLSLLSSVAQGQMTTLNLVVSLVSLALAVAILVLLWRKESSAYYDAVKAQQRV